MKKEISIGRILKTSFAVGMIGLGSVSVVASADMAIGGAMGNCNIDFTVAPQDQEWIHCEGGILPTTLDYSHFPDEPVYVGWAMRFGDGKGVSVDTQDGIQIGVQIADPEKEYGDY